MIYVPGMFQASTKDIIWLVKFYMKFVQGKHKLQANRELLLLLLPALCYWLGVSFPSSQGGEKGSTPTN